MRLFVSVVVLAGFALAAPSALARDPAAILADVKAATGGAAWDDIRSVDTTVTVKTSGLEGTATSHEDTLTGRYVDRYDLGPIKGADGYDGKTPWSQDQSGQVARREGGEAPQIALTEAYRRAMAYWYPERGPKAVFTDLGERTEEGRTFEVVGITPEGGHAFEMWVDKETHLVDRIVEKQAVETSTTYLSDYRPEGAIIVPHASRTSNGETQYDAFAILTAVTLNGPVSDGDFAIPASTAADFAIDGGASETEIPFKLINNHIYVEVMLNGKGPIGFMVDTGGLNLMTPELAAELGLEATGAVEGRGTGEGSVDVAMTTVGELRVGGAVVKDQVFYVFALGAFGDIEGVKFNGLIGFEVFKRFVARIDYENGKLTLIDPKSFAYPDGATAIPFVFDETTPEIEAVIDGVKGRFSVDTGSRVSLTLMAPFVEAHGFRTRYAQSVEAVAGWGVGGPSRGQMVRAGTFSIAPYDVPGVVVDLSRQTEGSFAETTLAGNIGGGFLKRFTVTFNYGDQTMYLEPNALFAVRDPYDRAGFWINRSGDGLAVLDVTAGSPAAEAGLQAGDMIVEVDGVTTTGIDMVALRQRLLNDEPGTVLRLTIERGGQRQAVAVTLRDQV